ncbi:MAG TPA: undecaprenyldiphospho-muramoylpentapeptide beta-N-acetylglucosaminyltransferase [Alkalispirochaeta sp.]|nr:undecaprenyldiphospho-muramoylpentapeptide beta-N-acetylglucosaminyltransferase [Alkalispirochaeta sp.]
MSTIVFTGGGTGGHVYPGLAVLAALTPENRSRVVWIGSRRGVERSIVTEAGVPYHAIPAGKLRRYFDLENILDAFRVLAGVFAAYRLLRRLSPAVVFSKGGYVAVPVVAAAYLRRVPVVIHESDADPGLATRITAPLASRILLPYEETRRVFPERWRTKSVVSGNPVRREFRTAVVAGVLQQLGLPESELPVILITGGSLGARQVNLLVRETISELTREAVVIHQTGDHSADMIPDIAARAKQDRYFGAPGFAAIFPALMRRADVVIARAGAGTIWEIAVCRRPAVLIPLSQGASRGDQVRNAARYAASGAAIVLDDPDLDGESMLQEIQVLIRDRARRDRMGRAAGAWAPGDAAERIAHEICNAAEH